MSGSANAKITIFPGTVFSNDKPVMLETMFPKGHGRSFGKGSTYHLFNLAVNSWQVHYWRLSNQLSDNFFAAKNVFENMNLAHGELMRRFSAHGGLKNWDSSGPSVWLTAWALRVYSWVGFQDWEDFVFIDPKVPKYGRVDLTKFMLIFFSFLRSLPVVPCGSSTFKLLTGFFKSQITHPCISLIMFIIEIDLTSCPTYP